MLKEQASAAVDWRQLVHELNQRYRREFDRAERLQAELNHLRGSRAWRLLCWWRRVKNVFWPADPEKAAPAELRSEPLTGELPPAAGSVSIVIPFRDRVELLRNCLVSLRRTAYRRFEILLVDNGSTCPRTRRLLRRVRQRRRIRLICCLGAFNFSRLCNRAADRARGDYLLFLNNDIEVHEPDWLERMLEVAGHPRVGVVGAMLLYPDGSVQHAGIFVDSAGNWRHIGRGSRTTSPGPQEERRPHCVPAVTGACLLIRRDLFRQMGGFDERLAVTGNDVDLCCRVRRQGLHVAITSRAQLIHFESLTRGYAVES